MTGTLTSEADSATTAMLARFADSDWPARLRAADRLFRDLEFLAPWPGGPATAIRGTIDFLWQEGDGWHVLALNAGENRAPAGRVVEGWAVQEQFGAPPASVTLLDLQTGAETRVEPGPPPWAELVRGFPRVRVRQSDAR